MHEVAIALSLVQAAEREARAAGATRIERVDLRLGSLAGVDPQALAFSFPVVARGTSCEGAELRIEITPATGRCPACGATAAVHELMDRCPACGEWPLRVEGGRDMILASLAVA